MEMPSISALRLPMKTALVEITSVTQQYYLLALLQLQLTALPKLAFPMKTTIKILARSFRRFQLLGTINFLATATQNCHRVVHQTSGVCLHCRTLGARHTWFKFSHVVTLKEGISFSLTSESKYSLSNSFQTHVSQTRAPMQNALRMGAGLL